MSWPSDAGEAEWAEALAEGEIDLNGKVVGDDEATENPVISDGGGGEMSERPITEFGRDPMRPIPNAEDPVPELAEARSALAAAEARNETMTRMLREQAVGARFLEDSDRENEERADAAEDRAASLEQALREIRAELERIRVGEEGYGPHFRPEAVAALAIEKIDAALPEPAPRDTDG